MVAVFSLLEVLTVMVPMLLSVAFMTVVERKVMKVPTGGKEQQLP